MFKENKRLLTVPLQGPVLKGGISSSRFSCHCKVKWDHGGRGRGVGPESRESGKTHDSNSMNKLARYAVNSSDAEQK